MVRRQAGFQTGCHAATLPDRHHGAGPPKDITTTLFRHRLAIRMGSLLSRPPRAADFAAGARLVGRPSRYGRHCKLILTTMSMCFSKSRPWNLECKNTEHRNTCTLALRTGRTGETAGPPVAAQITCFQTGSGQSTCLKECRKYHTDCHMFHSATRQSCLKRQRRAIVTNGKSRHLHDDPVACPSPPVLGGRRAEAASTWELVPSAETTTIKTNEELAQEIRQQETEKRGCQYMDPDGTGSVLAGDFDKVLSRRVVELGVLYMITCMYMCTLCIYIYIYICIP